MPQAALTRSMTSGLSGSPAPMSSLMRTRQAARSSWISIRHTVGGAQKVVTPQRAMVSSRRARVEAPLIDDENRGLRVPRREETAPGMLGPARRRDVEMHVARPQPEPIHRRQVADRIALMAVQHELRRRRGAGGEIEQHRIVRPRLAVRRKIRGRLISTHRRQSSPAPPCRRRCACSRPADRRISPRHRRRR